ncbi:MULTISPECIES: ABC-three component system protein [Streptomyces]|uniref:ABC-three component system protein n=1 Tax=Streptomyces TaxID=1883 RepID=UPI000A88D531|nr:MULTISPECIES: ABC-three component system protein [Streptomyces]
MASAGAEQTRQAIEKPQLFNIDIPAGDSPVLTRGISSAPRATARQLITWYSPDAWEKFIREWAKCLDEPYTAVQQLGGADDHGIDVAGFLSEHDLRGPWDCFQCKHYAEALKPGQAFVEILKVFRSVIAGHYVMPRRYRFLAPQGCGTGLARLLIDPPALKSQFMEKVQTGTTLTRGMSAQEIASVRELCSSDDFTRFKEEDVDDVLLLHKEKSPYHASRFGTDLPPRPANKRPPDLVDHEEFEYVSQLIEVYREEYPRKVKDLADALSHPEACKHFVRQREDFYSAESLRLFARDQVPPGTFEELQDEIYTGVVDVEESRFHSGMERLRAVLKMSTQLDITSNMLINSTRLEDRKGICHHLANKGRLTWCRSDDDADPE